MSDLRTAAQQALDAMKRSVPTGRITLYEWDKALSDLDAALAQEQAEPVEEPVQESALQAVAEKIGDQCAVWYGIGARDVEEVLREAARYGLVRAAQAEPVQEPVAWMYTGVMSNGIEHGPHLIWKPESMDAMSASKGVKATPLYTAPPKAEPLPLKTVERLIYENTKINPNVADDRELLGYIVNAVRAVERAHGIGGQDER